MISAAIVGLGRWGRLLVDSVQESSEAIRFTCGVTRTPARAEDYCRDKGIALGGDYAEVLADPAVDAVVLATPHTQHAAQIVAAAEAGKHVFVEKPFTLDGADAERAVKACADAGVAVAVGHNRRFFPAMGELKRMIDAGELGTLMHIEANFSASLSGMAKAWRNSREESPAGGMTSLGIHALDAMVHLCGKVRIIDSRSIRRAIPFDIDDTTTMLMTFVNGMTGYLATLAATGHLWHLRVFGDKGWAEMRGYQTLVRQPVEGDEEVIDFSYGMTATLRDELEAFASAAAGGAPFPIPPDEIVHGIACLDAIIDSARRGSPCSVH